MFAISATLDSQLAILVGALITLVGSINYFLLKNIKKTTGETNYAVNHRDQHQPTISKQVDQSANDIVDLKFDIHHVKKDVGEMKIGLNNLQGAMENLLQSHVANKSKLDEVLKTMPKRKTDER